MSSNTLLMIRIYLGNLGSGKTCSAVREMMKDGSNRVTYTNIAPKKHKHWKQILPENVITKTEDDKGKVKLSLNKDFWANKPKPLNLIWDEIHLIAPSRRSSSSPNIILGQFIAMGRRIVGADRKGYGHLIFIAQSAESVDVAIRRLTNEIRYHIMNWLMTCDTCGLVLKTTSEDKEVENCPSCGGYQLFRHSFHLQVFTFKDFNTYLNWKAYGEKSYSSKYWVTDIADFFPYYSTHQMESIWEDYLS